MTTLILYPTDRPLPLEILAKSNAVKLFHQVGYNRKRGVACQISSKNDYAAVMRWLEEFKISPKTYRSYHKEVERFCNWLRLVPGKTISDVKIEDIDAYTQFMANPQPAEDWISQKRHFMRNSPEWRPFEKPASEAVQKYANSVLSALFAYLRDVGYLYESPFAAKRLKDKKNKAANKLREKKEPVIQYLSASVLKRMFSVFESSIEEIEAESRSQQLQIERYLFLTRFLANTGLRCEEIALTVMSDIYSEEFNNKQYWYIRVLGKGDKVRHVPLNIVARATLTRYLRVTQRPEQFLGNHMPLFIPLISRATPTCVNVSPQTIYTVIKNALLYAAKKLTNDYPDDAYKLKHSSPHKFRHSFATVCAQIEGMSLPMIQDLLGHASIETTRIYLHTDKIETSILMSNSGL